MGPFVDPAKFGCAKRAENMDREAETEILTGFAQSAIKTGRTSFFYNVRAPNLKHQKIVSPLFARGTKPGVIYSRFSRSFTARGYLLGNPPGYKANQL